MNELTSDEVAAIQSLWQRPHLYAAVFGDRFQLKVETVLKDAQKRRRVDLEDWRPVINIGPHRLGFVGEAVGFDALDSYKVTLSAPPHTGHHPHHHRKHQRHRRAHAQGYGKGAALGLIDWHVEGPETWSRLGRPWDEPQAWTPTEAGLYLLRARSHLCPDNTFRRWMRIYADRASADWGVIAIDGLSGSWGGGWSCNLTLATEDIGLVGTGIEDYQAIGIYCEDEWFVDGTWVTRPIGASRQEPRAVMIGYVKEGTIEKSFDGKTVHLTLESVTGQMERSKSHKVAIWKGSKRKRGHLAEPDADGILDEDLPTEDEEEDIANRKKRRRHKKRSRHRRDDRDAQRDSSGRDESNGVDSWGAILQGFSRVCISDFALWYLQFKTNLLEWHDFYAIWNEDQADLESIAGEETSVLSNLSTVGQNDWYLTGATCDNALYFAPDRQISRDLDWDALWPERMTLGDHELFSFQLTEQHERPIKYVKLVATKTNDFGNDEKRRRKPRHSSGRNHPVDPDFTGFSRMHKKQIEVAYPSRNPPTNVAGDWYVRKDLLHDNRRVIESRAQQAFIYLNRKWSGQAAMGLNRALSPGYLALLAPNTEEWEGTPQSVLITGYSAEIDVANQTWLTSIEFEQYMWAGSQVTGSISLEANSSLILTAPATLKPAHFGRAHFGSAQRGVA